MDDETRWSWRWRCPAPGCRTVIQGSGTETDRRTAQLVIAAHQDQERIQAKRAS